MVETGKNLSWDAVKLVQGSAQEGTAQTAEGMRSGQEGQRKD